MPRQAGSTSVFGLCCDFPGVSKPSTCAASTAAAAWGQPLPQLSVSSRSSAAQCRHTSSRCQPHPAAKPRTALPTTQLAAVSSTTAALGDAATAAAYARAAAASLCADAPACEIPQGPQKHGFQRNHMRQHTAAGVWAVWRTGIGALQNASSHTGSSQVGLNTQSFSVKPERFRLIHD